MTGGIVNLSYGPNGGSVTYRGYTAEINREGDILVGFVPSIPDALLFEVLAVNEVEPAFHSVIDTYLRMCEEDGVEPETQ